MNDNTDHYKKTLNNYFSQKKQIQRKKSARLDLPVELFVNKNYQHIKSKQFRLSYNDLKQQENLKTENAAKVAKFPIKKKVLNDYIEVVNKRKELVDQIQQQAVKIDKISTETSSYFNKYYNQNSFFKRKLDNLLLIILPENKFVKQMVRFNESKIKSMMQKAPQDFQDEDEPEHNIISKHKFITQKQRLLALSGEMTRPVSQCIQNKLNKIGYLEQQSPVRSKSSIQMIEIMKHRENLRKMKLQDKMLEQELKCQGNENIKRRIFQKGMKLLQQESTQKMSQSQDDLKNQSVPQSPSKISSKDFRKRQSLPHTLTIQRSQSFSPKKSIEKSVKQPSPAMSRSLFSRQELMIDTNLIKDEQMQVKRQNGKVIYFKEGNTPQNRDSLNDSINSKDSKDVFEMKKKNQQKLSKYYYNNAKVKENGRDSEIDNNTPIMAKSKVFDENKKMNDLRKKLVPDHYKNSKSEIVIAYKNLQEDCLRNNEENKKIRTSIEGQRVKQKKDFKKISGSYKQMEKLKNQLNFRYLTGCEFPIKEQEELKKWISIKQFQ